MAFGGYKFKGYKVVRDNLATNTYANWCLLVHQARIKAFMESCALSGAQWHFSKTNGPLAFESYGNVIYRVANANGDYHDYLSFFQYGDENLYYMLATLGEYYAASSIGTPSLGDYTSPSNYQWQGGSSTTSLLKYAGYASALSLEPFADDGPFGAYPTKALPCTSQRASGTVNTYTNGVKEGTSGHSISNNASIKAGYATKGKDIITVFNGNKGCVESGDAFSSLCDPNDIYGLVKINLGHKNSETSTKDVADAISLDGWCNECLDVSGNRLNKNTGTTTSDKNVLALVPSGLPYLNSGGQFVPYGSAYLSLLTTVNNLGTLNSNKMLVKGVIRNELLSVNCFASTTKDQQPNIGSTVMGGNLLVMTGVQLSYTSASSGQINFGRLNCGYVVPGTGYTGGTNFDVQHVFPVAYVGWDPSNPDITNESSWPELALQ